MPKRRVNRYRFTPARKAAIRKAQAASAAKRRKKSYSAPNVRAGVFPKTKAQRNAYYRNSGMALPSQRQSAPKINYGYRGSSYGTRQNTASSFYFPARYN